MRPPMPEPTMAVTSTPRWRASCRTAGVMRMPAGTWTGAGAAVVAGAGGAGAGGGGSCGHRRRSGLRGRGGRRDRSGLGDRSGRRRSERLARPRERPPPGVPAATAPAISISAMATSLAMVSPSATRMLVSVPSNGDGTSALTLSVTTSTMGSPIRTWSPTALSHLPMVPCSTPSPSWGMVTWGIRRLLGRSLAGSRWALQGSEYS